VTRTFGVLRRRGRTLTPAARHFRLTLRHMAPVDVDRLQGAAG
jgi:hypothetical protein